MKYFTLKQPQSKNRVTQEFWARPEFYSQFGFKGHEWVDLNDIPWSYTPIYAVEEWIIVVKEKNGAYGLRVDIYSESLGILFSYCHLSSVLVKTKDKASAGQILGYTGNSSTYAMPIHLHFMAFEIDSNLDILNTRNWYSWAIKCWVEDNKLYIEPTRRVISSYRGVKIEKKEQPKEAPKRLWAYSPTSDSIILYPRAFELDDEKWRLLIEHEFSHKIYWKEFSKADILLWEQISRLDSELIKKNSAFKNFINKYISEWETNESEDFAETYEDIVRKRDMVYGDYRDIKRRTVIELLNKYWYKI